MRKHVFSSTYWNSPWYWLLILGLLLNPWKSWAVEGELQNDTIWDAPGSPYRITADLTIPVNRELRIAPGVTIQLSQGTRLTVYGTLRAPRGSSTTGSWKMVRIVGGPASW